jgi:hypothetical protein
MHSGDESTKAATILSFSKRTESLSVTRRSGFIKSCERAGPEVLGECDRDLQQ